MDSAPLPKDLSHHYSRIVQRTPPSAIKKFYKYFLIPEIGNLAGGLPDPQYFPYDTLEARVASPDRFKPTPANPVEPGPPTSKADKQPPSSTSSHIVVPHDSSTSDRTKKLDVATLLQYGTGTGNERFRQWIREFTRTKMHPNVPYRGGPETIFTDGSTDGFNKILQVFTHPWDDRKDWIRDRQSVLCEDFSYLVPPEASRSRGLNAASVATDEQGMLAEGPGGLRDVLENWDRSKGRLPHLMYTIPVGQNPTSGVLSLDRMQQIYKLCQQYDILIVEDDPYWFLQYPSANTLSAKYRGTPVSAAKTIPDTAKTWKSSGSPFLDSLVPSYLSIDMDGRVIRIDTFSKTIAPGCRLGWITAQPEFVEKILIQTDYMTMQPSGFTQAMVAELVLGQSSLANAHAKSADQDNGNPENRWQTDGWIRWLEGLRGNYERRMQTMCQILEEGKYQIVAQPDGSRRKVSPAGSDDFEIVSRKQMLDFSFPMGGMFLWLRVCFENHPLFDHPRIPRDRLSWAFFVFLTLPQYKVLVAPGFFFPTDKENAMAKGYSYFRTCFSAVHEDILTAKSHSLVQASNDFFDIDDAKVIEDILRDDAGSAEAAMAQLKMSGDIPNIRPFMY